MSWTIRSGLEKRKRSWRRPEYANCESVDSPGTRTWDMPSSTERDLGHVRDLARRIRRDVLDMTVRAGSAHIGGSFSVADIRAVLYGCVLKLDPKNPAWAERDRLVYSKGHACAALYAALAEVGFFPVGRLDTFYGDGSTLVGHATHAVPGVEYSTGSLGHGLSVACVMAYA